MKAVEYNYGCVTDLETNTSNEGETANFSWQWVRHITIREKNNDMIMQVRCTKSLKRQLTVDSNWWSTDEENITLIQNNKVSTQVDKHMGRDFTDYDDQVWFETETFQTKGGFWTW